MKDFIDINKYREHFKGKEELLDALKHINAQAQGFSGVKGKEDFIKRRNEVRASAKQAL